MLLEEQRVLHEDIERLEAAVADRLLEEPKNVRGQLSRDHEIATFINRFHEQSKRLLDIYDDADHTLSAEIQAISTGDPFLEFDSQLKEIKDFHKRNPNEKPEDLERLYKRRQGDGAYSSSIIDSMFSGEEGFGRYFDLNKLHEMFLNLDGVRTGRHISYIQYLETFDKFTNPKRKDKLNEGYFAYVTTLADYLEDFMKKTRPLEDLDKVFQQFSDEFDLAWEADEVEEWKKVVKAPLSPDAMEEDSKDHGTYCADCEKDFSNRNVYEHHFNSKKHKKNAEAKSQRANGHTNGDAAAEGELRLKERATAYQEWRVKKLSSAMQTQRADTRVNVERKQGMTDKERQQELQALYETAAQTSGANEDAEDEDENDTDKIYNPLKLPLAWDGKPIPFWLYKLHGLGVEFICEICGNFVYMGRRAFDKHFNEPRHIYGLKCLNITSSTTMFREITKIAEAQKLWDKMQRDKQIGKKNTDNVVQMEDGEGNVMPEKVYYDLQKQGLI